MTNSSDTASLFEVFRALEAFYSPNDAVLETMRAAAQAAVEAAQAIAAAMQPFLEAVNSWWYGPPADLRRAILAASRADEEVLHTRHAMRRRKIRRVMQVRI